MIDAAPTRADANGAHARSPGFQPLTRPCVDCGQPVDGFIAACDNCMDARNAQDQQIKQREEYARRSAVWQKLCPPNYRNTDWNRPELSDRCRELAHSWSVAADGLGLGLWGPTGRGKTRAMWEILKRHHFGGMKVFAVDAMEIQKTVSDYHSTDAQARDGARKLLASCHTAALVLVDDIGKGRPTDAVAGTLHEIIEVRSRKRLPTLWTTEHTGPSLAQRLGRDFADGLTRRLREFSTIVQV